MKLFKRLCQLLVATLFAPGIVIGILLGLMLGAVFFGAAVGKLAAMRLIAWAGSHEDHSDRA